MHPLSGITVLQIVPSLGAGTVARAALDIAAALAAAGARSLVACAGGPLKSELQATGGIFVPFPTQTKNPAAMVLNMRRLARLIAAERADIVHVRSRACAWVAYGATRLARTPFITSFGAGNDGANPIALRYNSVLARGDAVLADSHFAAGLLAKTHFTAPEKIRIVRHGLDCRIFAPSAVTPARVHALRQEWNAAPHERIVFLPSPARPGSGHEVLIKAAGLLTRSGLGGAKFILAGSREGTGARDREADRAIAREGLQEIMYRGHISDLPAALLAASMVVLPATEPHALGAAAIQAQAMGTPVIAAHLGAAPEIVLAPPAVAESARSGFLFPPGDAAALALTIAEVLNLGATAGGRLSAHAIEHVQKSFSSERMCVETLQAYADVRWAWKQERRLHSLADGGNAPARNRGIDFSRTAK